MGGCNSGACHGTPTGKNGFKLSLRGYDPAADYLQLTRDVLGRRTDRLGPDSALILQKLNEIVFPEIKFREAAITDIIQYLSDESRHLDPKKEGVNIVLSAGVGGGGGR